MISRTKARNQSPYIVSRGYDWSLFLLPPVLALALGIAISDTFFSERSFVFWGQEFTLSGLAVQILIHAHLVAVVFRSHGNLAVLRRHPGRFLVVPILLYAAIVWSTWVLVCVSVLATFWDVYHSGLQTFGFARIYDRKQGNDPTVGRRLDWWLQQLCYAGPIVAGATMLDHFEDFEQFAHVEAAFLTAIPAHMTTYQPYFTWTLVIGGSAFLLYYVIAYWRLARRGYRISPCKVYLLVSTGLCSIYTWGFNSWGEAFFIMNLFHAVQYLGLVWAADGRRLSRLGQNRLPRGQYLGWVLFMTLTIAYGVWVQAVDASVRALWAITLVVAIMHFWYDGFIWSVRKHHL